MAQYTDDQLLEAISLALKARAFDAVIGLLFMLAIQAPDKAQAILDTIKAASTLDAA